MSGGKGAKEQRVTQSVDIPDFLQPLIRQSAGTSADALRQLQTRLGGNLVAGFDPAQLQAQQQALGIAGGAGGFIPTAQNTFLQAAQGLGLDQFLPSAAFNRLTGTPSFLPQAGTAALTGLASGRGAPGLDALRSLQGQAPAFFGGLSSFSGNPFQFNDQSLDTLRQTAAGDFLAGGPGFDAAIDAAVRRAQPAIGSAFGRTRGGIGSGLAQAAIAQQATDAFASQFGQERGRQLNAANALAALDQAQRGQRFQEATGLAGLGLQQRGQDLNIAQGLQNATGQQLQALGLLGNIGQGEAAQALSGAGTLANLSNAERQRQLMAAQGLPQLGLAGADIFSRIGGQRQAQEQRELLAPAQQLQQLLAASQGITGGFAPLFGQTQVTPLQSNPLQGAIGGALTGFQLGGPWGAAAGGLLGGILS